MELLLPVVRVLSTQSETVDDGAVTLDVLLRQVLEETATATDHEQETAATVVIAEVVEEIADADLRKKTNTWI